MQGASALQELLDELQSLSIQVLVVWEPVLWTDLNPPTSWVLGRTSDMRAVQFWDEDRLLSEFIVKAAKDDPTLLKPGDTLPSDRIVWDFVAIFPPGARWGNLPRPAYYGGPVVETIDDVRSVVTETQRLTPVDPIQPPGTGSFHFPLGSRR